MSMPAFEERGPGIDASVMAPSLSPEAAQATQIPLCVDLDGTLVRTDTLVESIVALLRRNPAYLFALPIWLIKGKAYLKEEVARRVAIDVASLPYHRELLTFLRDEKRRGRNLVLVTGANEHLAKAIANHLEDFNEVLASDAQTNLSGRKKLHALDGRFGSRGYDYAANSAVDLPIWSHARHAIVVNASRHVVAKARRTASVVRVFERSSRVVRDIAKVIRVHQWAKNALVFVPLITSHNVTQVRLLLAAVLAFVAFNLCASTGYVVNDLVDLEADRKHPKKRYRPFASGNVPLLLGWAIAPFFLCASALIGLMLPWGFAYSLGLYLLLTGGYSFYLKRFALVDVIVLAGLYTMRIYAGAEAIGVAVSHWLLAFSVFLFLSLAFIKRFSELRMVSLASKEAIEGRGYLAADLDYVATVGAASGYIAVLVLALYVSSQEVSGLYSKPELLWLVCPLILYWISRAWLLAHRNRMHEDPIVFAVKDVKSYVVGIIAAIIMTLAK